MQKKVIRKIRETEVNQDKNQRNFKSCTFSHPNQEFIDIPGVGKVQAQVLTRETTISLWEKSYLNEKEQFGYSAPVDTYFLGGVETRFVEPYDVPDKSKGNEGKFRKAQSFTTVVFGDSSNLIAYEQATRATFKARGHQIVDTPASTTPAESPVKESTDKTAKVA